MGYESNDKFKNLNLYAKSDVNVRSQPNTSNASYIYTAKQGEYIGYSTGEGYKSSGGTLWVQVVVPGHDNDKLWVSYKYVKTKTVKGDTITKEDAQKALDKLIMLDLYTYNQALVLMKVAEAKKLTSQKNKIYDIYTELIERQKGLKQAQFISDLKYGNFKSKVNAWLKFIGTSGNIQLASLYGTGLGFPWIPVVIGAVVVAGATVALMKWLEPNYDASKKNYKEIKELEEILKDVDQDKAEKIKQEIEKQIDDAYNAGKRNQFWAGTGRILKIGGIVVVALWAIPKVTALTKKRNKTIVVQNPTN